MYDIADRVDIEKLKRKIPDIKQVMFMKANQIQEKLSNAYFKWRHKARIH